MADLIFLAGYISIILVAVVALLGIGFLVCSFIDYELEKHGKEGLL